MEVKLVLRPDGRIECYWPRDKFAATVKLLETALAAIKDEAFVREMQPAVQAPDAGLQSKLLARGQNGVG